MSSTRRLYLTLSPNQSTVIAICSKVVTGIYEWDSKWSVGWAMVGRGELGLVMAEEVRPMMG